MIGNIFVLLGIYLLLISTIGIIRFSNFYTKLHVSSIIDSSGAMLLLSGYILKYKFSIIYCKIMLLIFIIWISNSTNAYILSQAYYNSKEKILQKKEN